MSVHKQWLEKLKTFPGSLTLPPPTLQELQIEYLEIVPGKVMTAKLPFQKRFINPVGVYQGAFLARPSMKSSDLYPMSLLRVRV